MRQKISAICCQQSDEEEAEMVTKKFEAQNCDTGVGLLLFGIAKVTGPDSRRRATVFVGHDHILTNLTSNANLYKLARFDQSSNPRIVK